MPWPDELETLTSPPSFHGNRVGRRSSREVRRTSLRPSNPVPEADVRTTGQDGLCRRSRTRATDFGISFLYRHSSAATVHGPAPPGPPRACFRPITYRRPGSSSHQRRQACDSVGTHGPGLAKRPEATHSGRGRPVLRSPTHVTQGPTIKSTSMGPEKDMFVFTTYFFCCSFCYLFWGSGLNQPRGF